MGEKEACRLNGNDFCLRRNEFREFRFITWEREDVVETCWDAARNAVFGVNSNVEKQPMTK